MSEEDFNNCQNLFEEDKVDECLKALQKFLLSTNDDEMKFKALNMKIILCINNQKWQDALETTQESIKLYPAENSHYSLKAFALFQLKDPLALETYKTCIDRGYKLAESYYYRGIIFQEKQEYAKALIEFEASYKNKDIKSEEEDEQDNFQEIFPLLISLGKINRILKQETECMKYLDEALKNPQLKANDKQKILNEYGSLYLSQGNLEKAIATFEEAIQLNSNDQQSLINLSNLYLRQQNYDQALQVLDKGSKKDQISKIINQKGLIYQMKGDYVKSIEEYKKLINNGSNTEQTNNNIAMAYLHTKNYDEAIKYIDIAINLKPNDPTFYINKGNILDSMHKYDLAIEAYNQVLKLDPNNSDVLNNKGITLINKNDRQGSLQCFKESIRLNPNQILAYTNKSQIELSLGNGKQALADMHIAQKLINNKEAIKNLSHDQCEVINKQLSSVIDLEQKFNSETKALEQAYEQMQTNAQQEVSQEKKELLEEYIKLKQQKDKDSISILRGLNVVAPQSSQPQQINKQSQQKVEDNTNNQEIYNQLRMLTEKLHRMEEDNKKLKETQEQIKEKQIEINQKIDNIDQILEDAGTKDTAKILAGWKEYQNYPDLYDYTKTFYWTLLNLIDGYRAANTGMFQTNDSHTEVKSEKTAMAIAGGVLKVGAKLAESVPLVGSIISVINSGITAIYGVVKTKHKEDRIKSICYIVQKNNDPKAQLADQFGKQIALAALEIAERKREIILKKREEADNPKPASNFQKVQSYITDKINQVKAKIIGPEVDIYSSVGGQLALQDVTILIVYMTQNYLEIVAQTSKQSLAQIIADSVIKKKFMEVLNEMDDNLIEKANDNVIETKENLNQIEEQNHEDNKKNQIIGSQIKDLNEIKHEILDQDQQQQNKQQQQNQQQQQLQEKVHIKTQKQQEYVRQTDIIENNPNQKDTPTVLSRVNNDAGLEGSSCCNLF